ncbi:MAG: amidohydrolase [Lachnospiraceae bacterium]|nr:amidohydrolase [Lachnospiraceae bacterium]
MDLYSESLSYKEKLIELRREFHRYPARTGKEEPTIERIDKKLTELGIGHEVIDEGGILAYIYGKGFEPEEGKEPWLAGYVEDGDTCLATDAVKHPEAVKIALSSNSAAGRVVSAVNSATDFIKEKILRKDASAEGTRKTREKVSDNDTEGSSGSRTTLTWKMKTVVIRADVDALPVQESECNLKGIKVCVSEVPGVSHTCGHDAHMAMALAEAEFLQNHRELINGRVIFLFERGEEGPNNIIRIYRRIMQKNLHFDTVYGNHVYYDLESGKMAIQPGPVMAGGVFFKMIIRGRGGHGSRPDMAVNPIDCYVAVMNAMNDFRMKHVDPFHPITYAPTIVQSGSADNIIPGELTFGGNLRIYEHEDGVEFKKYFKDTLDHICPLYGCEYETMYNIGPKMPVKNDPDCTALCEKAVGEAIGANRIVQIQPWMANESICSTMAIWPGVYTFLGTKNPEKGAGALHHSPEFDIDEDVLPLGMAAALAYTFAFLDSDVKPSHGWFKGSIPDLYDISGYGEEKVNYLRYGTPCEIHEGLR